NTESASHYLRRCRDIGQRPHPARFPSGIPRFFIRFLTDPDDVVLDIFSGSNTTGRVAEEEGRRWLAFELDLNYAKLSAVRFMESWDAATVRGAWDHFDAGTWLDITPAGPVPLSGRPPHRRR
ncbi:MAG: site-specific DNA-methyltransferase, partial [Chloroflexi bacterium]|nr:site-specific DNA-methyltransferase [Chloroflexota bacterium]